MKYRTREGDMLDQLCLKHYGRADVVPQVLAANPRLPDIGSVLPANTVIELPEITVEKKTTTTRLWD